MGKKYIVEIGRLERLYKAFIGAHGKPEITWLSPEVDLTPYTEPDLDAIRKEAYDKAFEDTEQVAESGKKAMYQKGLKDAWEAAGKISMSKNDGGLSWEAMNDIFGTAGSSKIYKKFTAPEAIEKIRQYDQGRITKGDVVRIKSAPEIEILVTYANGEYVGGIALTEVDDSCEIGDQFTDIVIHKVEKTGRHYEIAEVLRKMDGEE